MEADQTNSTIKLQTHAQPLEVDIKHSGERIETAIYTQFANQYSRFTVFKNNSRFIWKLLDKGRMLVIDTFTNLNRIFNIQSINAKRTPVEVICCEQISENSGFVIFIADNAYYIANAYLHFHHGLLQVDTEKAVLIDNANRYSMASIDWSSTRQFGFVMLGQITFGCALTFFFKIDSSQQFDIFSLNFYRPPMLMQNASPLIFDNGSTLMMVRTENRDEWIYYSLNERQEIVKERKSETLKRGRDNIGNRFTSIWTFGKQNLYMECPKRDDPLAPIGFGITNFESFKPRKNYSFGLYNQLTERVQEVKLPSSVFNQLNESLNSSICMALDGIMLICSESRDKKKLSIRRVPIRRPDLLYNLTVIAYRQSSYFNDPDSQKLPDQIFEIASPRPYSQKELKRSAFKCDVDQPSKRRCV